MIRPLLLFLCLLGCALHAQPSDAPRPARLRFLFLDESPGDYSLKPGPDQRRISGNPYEISAPFIPSDLKPIDIYKTLPDPKTGVGRPTKIATLTPPADTPSALVIITPRPPASPDAAPVYQTELLDCDPSDFPAGSIRIINRGPVAMAAQFGDSRVVTASGATSLIQPSTDPRRRVLFKIAIQVQQDAGGWRLIQDSITVIRAKERLFGILVYSPGGMKHTLTAAELAEFGPPKPGCFWLTFSDTP